MSDAFTDAEELAQIDLKEACDLIVVRAVELMVLRLGTPMPMMLDRILSYAAAQTCSIDGKPAAARMFRSLADNIEAGRFDTYPGEGQHTDKRVH